MAPTKQQYIRKKLPEVKVHPRGGSWQADVTWQGVRKRPTFQTVDEAQIWAADQTARMTRGQPLADPDGHVSRTARKDGKPVTMRELFDYTVAQHWMKRGPNGGPMLAADKSIIAARQAMEAIGADVPFQTVTRKHIERQFHLLAAERSNSAATTNRRIAALSVMFGYGEREYDGWRAPRLDKTEEDNARSFRITPALETDMLRWFLARDNVDMYDFCVLSLGLGQRENETLRLRLGETSAHKRDGYIDDGFAIFPGQVAKNKSGRARFVPIRPIVQEVIDRRRAQAGSATDRILPAHLGKNTIPKQFKRMVKDLCRQDHPEIVAQKKLSQDLGHDFVAHIMRHEFCSRLGDDGFDLAEIKQYSGHKTDSMAARYVKDNKVALRMRMKRDSNFDPNVLSGGAVPDFAPSLNANVVALPARKVVTKPVVDAKAALATLKAAGLTRELLLSLLADDGSKSVAG